MDMCDAIGVLLVDQWSHRYDIFGIIVFDGPQIAELALTCGLVDDNVGGLHIDMLSLGFGTHKINLACLQLADSHIITLSY